MGKAYRVRLGGFCSSGSGTYGKLSVKKQFVNMQNQPKMEQFLSEIISLMSLELFIDPVIEVT